MTEQYFDLTLEEVTEQVNVKLEYYLNTPIIKNKNDKMMMYEEKLAAEAQLFQIYRQLNNILDIINKDD